MFKSFFEATAKNIWAIVLFFFTEIQNFGWTLFVAAIIYIASILKHKTATIWGGEKGVQFEW